MFHPRAILLLVIFIFPLAGCRTEPPAANDATFPTRQSYSVSAKVLHDKVKAALTSPAIGLAVVSDDDGRLTTDWKAYEGAHVGVGALHRTWQERTRYTITISPAWDDPAGKSTLEVTEETQQRPHEHYEWGSQDPVKRPERASELVKEIDAALRGA